MKEWTDQYNSFNSWKGLLYKDNYDGILKRSLLPPIEVNIDPSNNCQLDCIWCNSKDVITKQKCVMTIEHLVELINYCSEWGVKAICFAGGGEPSLCKDLAYALRLTRSNGMETAIITNGLFINSDQLQAIAETTRWCGISVDAAKESTYKKLKGVNALSVVQSNIRKLAELRTKEVTVKFLIHPENQNEIAEACFQARCLGANGFHVRILAEKYIDSGKFDYQTINYQLEKCRKYETPRFRVFTIVHKQSGIGNVRMRFDKCKASPLLCMMEANGDVSICIDRKGQKETRLCSHIDVNELRTMWGSEKHFELIDKINPSTDCKKCTLTCYQEQIEAIESDKFCANFP